MEILQKWLPTLPSFNVIANSNEERTPDSQPTPSTQKSQKQRKRISTKQLEKPFLECKWGNCRQVFETTLALKDHLEDHLGRGNSSYVCMWEGCQFGERKKRDHMKSHIRKHHQHIGFHCEKCGVGYVRDQELRQHVCNGSQKKSRSDSEEEESLQTSPSPSPSSPSMSSGMPTSPFSSDYEHPPEATLKRERSNDDFQPWSADSEDFTLTPALFLKLDVILDELEKEPECFDACVNSLKPYIPTYKRAKQRVEEFKLSQDEDIVGLLEQYHNIPNQPTQTIVEQFEVHQLPNLNDGNFVLENSPTFNPRRSYEKFVFKDNRRKEKKEEDITKSMEKMSLQEKKNSKKTETKQDSSPPPTSSDLNTNIPTVPNTPKSQQPLLPSEPKKRSNRKLKDYMSFIEILISLEDAS